MTLSMIRRTTLGLMGAALVALATTSGVVADDAADVAAAAEKLRVAMVAGEGAALSSLVHAGLSYGHSNGRTEDKAAFVASLDKKNSFKSLTITKQVVSVVGNDAIVRHVFDSENNLPDGKTSTAYITVLQVWTKAAGSWQLLARQSAPIPRT
jgi:ketosteroid isomerase-like protein